MIAEFKVECYRPVLFPVTYNPYMIDERFKELYGSRDDTHELLSLQSYWYLYVSVKRCLKVAGEFWECGVYRGGSAQFIREAAPGKVLRLFDTFCGMPQCDPERDPVHAKGDFDDTSLERVKTRVGVFAVDYHKGDIPATFEGLEDKKIAFAHVDVDIYKSVKDCCEFIWPRLEQGGMILFDDYGHPTCPGARLAVDEYFDGVTVPVNLYTGQAMVFK